MEIRQKRQKRHIYILIIHIGTEYKYLSLLSFLSYAPVNRSTEQLSNSPKSKAIVQNCYSKSLFHSFWETTQTLPAKKGNLLGFGRFSSLRLRGISSPDLTSFSFQVTCSPELIADFKEFVAGRELK